MDDARKINRESRLSSRLPSSRVKRHKAQKQTKKIAIKQISDLKTVLRY